MPNVAWPSALSAVAPPCGSCGASCGRTGRGHGAGSGVGISTCASTPGGGPGQRGHAVHRRRERLGRSGVGQGHCRAANGSARNRGHGSPPATTGDSAEHDGLTGNDGLARERRAAPGTTAWPGAGAATAGACDLRTRQRLQVQRRKMDRRPRAGRRPAGRAAVPWRRREARDRAAGCSAAAGGRPAAGFGVPTTIQLPEADPERGVRCPWTGSFRDCGQPRRARVRPAPPARRARDLPSVAARA